MKSSARSLVLSAVLLLIPAVASATSAADVAKAQKILLKVVEIAAKYRESAIQLDAPTPLTDKSGKFFVPVNANGELTEWAAKTLNVQLGAMAGAKVGEEAGKRVAGHVPFGGLASGLMKNKGKELGAVAAVGGYDFIKQSSELSFNNLDDYAVYLHAVRGNSAGYQEALAAAMAVYPALEKSYDVSIKQAYQKASRNSAKKS